MLADAVYQFLVLRDPETRAGTGEVLDPADPRLVEAGSPKPSALEQQVHAAITSGNRAAAVQAAATYLAGRAATKSTDRQRLAAGAALFRVLRGHVHRDDGERSAVRALEDLTPLGIDGGGDPRPGLRSFRSLASDLLLADLLSPSDAVDRSAACSSILAAEASDRLLAALAGEEALPWRPAAAHGRVVLPFDLSALASLAGGRNEKPEVANQHVHDLPATTRSLTPAQLLATNAVRRYVGDLVILDQQLRRYTLGELAHVENVLASEEFSRVRRDLRRVVTEVSETAETETIDERDLQSTERDELRSELAKALRENIHVGAELSASVSGKTPNGEYVVAASGSFGYDRATEQREERAQTHAREMVERARQQITERTRTARTSTTTAEDEDTTTHGFDNSGPGTEHIVGVYRWIEKEYDLHLINLGRRLFYEIVLPEPAAFWKAVNARRTEVEAGPPPSRPAMPPVSNATAAEPLGPGHLSLRSGNGALLSRPERWLDLVALAGAWSVELPEPPAPSLQLNLQVSIEPLSGDNSGNPIHGFTQDGGGHFYWGVQPRTAKPDKPPVVPSGYEAVSGEAAATGEMMVRTTVGGVPPGAPFATRMQFEQGAADLLIGGRQVRFWMGAPGRVQIPETRALTDVFNNNRLTGEIPIALTSNLNSVVVSIRLTCVRTETAELAWTADVLDRFATAYADRVAAHTDSTKAAVLDQRQRDYVRSEASYREIERRELKRQVIDLLVAGLLEQLGATVTTPPSSDAEGHVLAGDIDAGRLPAFTRLVNFFEQAFDWTNTAAIYAPYFYGRASEWESAALVEEGDARFAAFLSAGAARVQIPAQLGFEPQVEAFFAQLDGFDPTDAVPWLATGRPIALDLAGAARGGFELWPGTVSGTQGSARVTVTGNTFDGVADANRELRIAGHIFRIVNVLSATELELDRPLTEQVRDAPFERGGIVLGPPIALRLPSTLVAIDIPDLALPTFAGRYS